MGLEDYGDELGGCGVFGCWGGDADFHKNFPFFFSCRVVKWLQAGLSRVWPGILSPGQAGRKLQPSALFYIIYYTRLTWNCQENFSKQLAKTD